MSQAQRNSENLPELKPRPDDAHKGSFGYDLIIGGSVGMAGAVVLAARGCLRSGAGVVRVVVPERVYEIVGAQLSCPLVHPLPDTLDGGFHPDAGKRTRALMDDSDAVAVGPGMGTQDETKEFVRDLFPDLIVPTVVDADGLNIVSEDPSLLEEVPPPQVLTPHPGEFARLTDHSIEQIQRNREKVSSQFADRYDLVLVLKGHRTVITDGERVRVNHTGNPGMATGGSGDVLTGMITAFLGRSFDPFDAARLAVYLHGRAGDEAADEIGPESLLASDLIDYLPQVIRAHRSS